MTYQCTASSSDYQDCAKMERRAGCIARLQRTSKDGFPDAVYQLVMAR
jgi:hypothetical protein